MFFCYVLVVYRSLADVQACFSLLHTLEYPLAIEDVAFGDIGHRETTMKQFFKNHAGKMAAGAVIAVASLALKKFSNRTTDDSQTAGA